MLKKCLYDYPINSNLKTALEKKRRLTRLFVVVPPQCIQFFDCCWTCDKHHSHHKPIHLGRLINMEPTNHPCRKEKCSSKPSWWCSMLIFRDVYESLFHRKKKTWTLPWAKLSMCATHFEVNFEVGTSHTCTLSACGSEAGMERGGCSD